MSEWLILRERDNAQWDDRSLWAPVGLIEAADEKAAIKAYIVKSHNVGGWFMAIPAETPLLRMKRKPRVEPAPELVEQVTARKLDQGAVTS